MDTAYDVIQQEALPDASLLERKSVDGGAAAAASSDVAGEDAVPTQTLGDEITDAVQSFQHSAWGARIGGLWESVKKQGEQALDVTKKDLSVASELATKEIASLSEQLRSSNIASQASSFVTTTAGRLSMDGGDSGSRSAQIASRVKVAPESTSKMFAVLKNKAQGQMEELEKVEFSKYLNKMGKDVSEFLKEAVTIEPGEEADYEGNMSEPVAKDVLFDVPDDIKRQIYSTRLDAQLHVLHTSTEPFVTEGDDSYAEFAKDFSVEGQTSTIAADLEQYPELRKSMEKLVPEKISYEEFWKRYYFLREQINKEELRRKQLISSSEEVADTFDWDADEEEEGGDVDDMNEEAGASTGATLSTKASNSTETLMAVDQDNGSKVSSSRPSSESSYDVVSTSNSQPDLKASKADEDDDEEEDWE
ncbi:hypothetical protein V1512DRAFT_263114 [Lipomyces arxii]|uniref:uncharacterized protein n=1 Tax=Lipomyces arxii TaxID=56418 RepID=UPI0034CDA88C